MVYRFLSQFKVRPELTLARVRNSVENWTQSGKIANLFLRVALDREWPEFQEKLRKSQNIPHNRWTKSVRRPWKSKWVYFWKHYWRTPWLDAQIIPRRLQSRDIAELEFSLFEVLLKAKISHFKTTCHVNSHGCLNHRELLQNAGITDLELNSTS